MRLNSFGLTLLVGSLPALNQCFLVGQTCPQGHQVESRVDEGCRSIESVAAGSSRLGKGS